MATDILIKRSSTPGAVPTTGDLSTGELAINTADKRLFTNNAGTIVEIGIAPTSIAVTNDATVGGTLDVTGDTTVADGTATNWTVTGTLTVPTPSGATDAASKGYVDTADNLKLDKAGDTMSGNLAMGTNKVTGLGTPSNDTDAATKGYVDAQITDVIDSAPGALDTLNELAAAINDDANFATTVTNALAGKLALAGGTMTGDITMGANAVTSTATPASADTLTRKGYVDDQDATKLNLSGGTMTGDIALGANKATSTATPATDDTLTRKGYVDSILGSATDAATSASEAADSATAAANSASDASDDADAAAVSASNASDSADAASSSASAASDSATSASNSATASANSATAAATSATNAENAYDSFDDRYLGAKASDPALDNDNDALIEGALYFNTTDGAMKVYDGSNWNEIKGANATFTTYKFTATSGQTDFTGTDDDGATLAVGSGGAIVTLNGVVLEDGTDYTTTSTTVTLTTGATTDDELNVLSFESFEISDVVPASTGGSFSGSVAFTAGMTTDTVGEATADTGVTIDGVLLKDNDIEATDATFSGGVYLGGTGSANYLDDYEEGTWTPVIQLNASPSYTTQEGTYVKIGSLVMARGFIEGSVDTSDPSAFAVSLPFVSAATVTDGVNSTGSMSLHHDSTFFNTGATDAVYFDFEGNINSVIAFGLNGNLTYRYNSGNINSSGKIRFTAIYETSA